MNHETRKNGNSVQTLFYRLCKIDRGGTEAKKIFYVIEMLKTQERISEKFVKSIRDGLYEIRAECGGNIFRVFFIFDNGNIVILLNCFQKKTQRTPNSEIEKALKIKREYYESKGNK